MIKLMIPWLLFPYLIDWFDGNFAKAALSVAFLMFVLCFDTLRRGFVIECTLVICLLGMALMSVYWPGLSTFENVKLLLYGVLTVIGWSSVWRGQPFTLQYGSEGVDEDARQSSAFFDINNTITKTWCMTFSINAVLAGLSLGFEAYWPVFLIGSYMSILVASVMTEVFPDAYFSKRMSANG
ncbi:hypothetical protein [Pseudomonas sp. 10S4]|uniref:hypothetical protein n=1 Tax=Pseudomonas sp. 10S4 TaxID=3048583 RepID=UPI002AC9908C|nr:MULTISPECIES: hypothetical protein [unclassified Pseudomonas]MEB0224435.1 hypothetical protein [Pseudomonas sp. 5S1]MEB0298754.1 hypothetical protein [Pseudomonas sp. 10S4]WPX15909.1 hypothetical protein RHM58_17505 [Pseudomonas sp. 10S4]